MPRTCFDVKTNTEKDILSFLKKSSDNLVIYVPGLELESNDYPEGFDSKETHDYSCGNRKEILKNNTQTIYDSGRTYYNVYDHMYVCPMDRKTLQNPEYCFFKFEFLRYHDMERIYNVKAFSLSDYQRLKV